MRPVTMNNLFSCFANSDTTRAHSALKVPISTSTRSSRTNLVAALRAVSGCEASSASRMVTGRPKTPPRWLNISTATLAPCTSWIDEVLYGLDSGSRIPILIGSAALALDPKIRIPNSRSVQSVARRTPPVMADSCKKSSS